MQRFLCRLLSSIYPAGFKAGTIHPYLNFWIILSQSIMAVKGNFKVLKCTVFQALRSHEYEDF